MTTTTCPVSSNSAGSPIPTRVDDAKAVPHYSPEADADRSAAEALVQCYWREIADPHGLVAWLPDCASTPKSEVFSSGSYPHRAQLLFPHCDQKIFVYADRRSPVGIRHLGKILRETSDGARPVHAGELRLLIAEELALRFGRPINTELLNLGSSSYHVTAFINREREAPLALSSEPLEAYVQSEQSLVHGHPFHPSPKARSGLSNADLKRYSPEVGAAFQLHYFAVRRDLVVQDSSVALTAARMVESEGPVHLLPDSTWTLIPAHPWQAGHLREKSGVQAAETNGLLVYLGPQGKVFRPTASVRTLFSQESDYFYKLSLSFRITNCLRRNALPELAAALRVNRIMTALRPNLAEHFPGFRYLNELAYMTVELPGLPVDEQRSISEGFGLMLRGSIKPADSGEIPLLAAALFGNGAQGRQLLHHLLKTSSGNESIDDSSIMHWFDCYLEQLLPPLLYLYDRVGLMFEPHLQNIVVSVRAGVPTSVYVRDFENARVVGELLPEHLAAQLTPSEKAELIYSEEKAWNRFAYCLFSNHLVEAVRQLTFGRPHLETTLWQSLRGHIESYRKRFPVSEESSPLDRLLDGAPFPAKTNLITRALNGKDADSSYVSLGSPWRPMASDPIDHPTNMPHFGQNNHMKRPFHS